MSIMPAVSEVDLILYHEAAVAAAFHISLVKSAFVSLSALAASINATVINALGGAAVEIIPRIDVLAAAWAASRAIAIALARQSSYRAPGVHNQALSLLVATDIEIHIEILKICGVPIQSGTLDVNMEQITLWRVFLAFI